LDSAARLTPQHHHLVPQRRILRLKPTFWFEWRGQDGQEQPQQRDHSINLGDSLISSTRIEFSVHTRAMADECARRQNHRNNFHQLNTNNGRRHRLLVDWDLY
jgi:hypothetical protein